MGSKHSRTCQLAMGSTLLVLFFPGEDGAVGVTVSHTVVSLLNGKTRRSTCTWAFVTGSIDGQCNSPRSKNSNCLPISSFTSLHSAQITLLLSIFHFSTTNLLLIVTSAKGYPKHGVPSSGWQYCTGVLLRPALCQGPTVLVWWSSRTRSSPGLPEGPL